MSAEKPLSASAPANTGFSATYSRRASAASPTFSASSSFALAARQSASSWTSVAWISTPAASPYFSAASAAESVPASTSLTAFARASWRAALRSTLARASSISLEFSAWASVRSRTLRSRSIWFWEV